jgi:hypothetical protein
MARGWESKSVESQQEESVSESEHKVGQPSAEELAAQKRHTDLVLMRKKLEHDLAAASNPRHREMLETGIADLERRIKAGE